jgi:2,3-bisphosphoglycerate-independent phosphoglycerate mutase
MSAYEVTDEVISRIESEKYDVIILNYANPDMVGHTGVYEAARKAIEVIDTCVGRVVEAMDKINGVVLLTADHGNAEQMIDYQAGGPYTAHTTYQVPFVLHGYNNNIKLKEGCLAHLAPTMLTILELPIPDEMTGESLI